jgi:hypothetical protein
MFISSSNQFVLEHARAISCNPQKDLSNSVSQAPIKDHLILALKGFVVRSQIPNQLSTFFSTITHAFYV